MSFAPASISSADPGAPQRASGVAWGGVSAGRVWVVSLVAAALVGAHLFDIATQWEHWPVSPYYMYAELEPGPYKLDYRVVGVRADGGEERLDAKWLRKSFSLLARDVDNPKKRAKLDESMRQYLKSTKDAKLAATDDDLPGVNTSSAKLPNYVGVRLYRQQWELRPDLTNVNRPDSNVLVAEVFEKGVTPTDKPYHSADADVTPPLPATGTTQPAKKKPKKKPTSEPVVPDAPAPGAGAAGAV